MSQCSGNSSRKIINTIDQKNMYLTCSLARWKGHIQGCSGKEYNGPRREANKMVDAALFSFLLSCWVLE